MRFLIHLRLKFVAVLVPIFLWGVFVSGGQLNVSFWLGFLLFHLCLYGGVNALNSYYDQDEGPIGGLRNPPKVDRSLFYLAWGIQIVGFALGFALPLGFRLIYLTAMGMSVAYSHPAIRLKGHPIGSAFIVAIGQGWLTYWAGWMASGGDTLLIFTPKGTLGGIAITLTTVGLYPLTQLYQLESDREKGDQTLALWLGTRKSFRFALICIALAGTCMVSLFWFYFRRTEGLALLGYFIGLWTIIYRWERNFNRMNQMEHYNMVMRLNLVNSSCFTVYLALHFLHVL
jgi:1,4-dihydroxy-2-naphthoate octaprenyltransferase